ncbi:MAG: hypothetical protein Q7S28_01975 [bacterium]|nr:hypothetical protein [bacterium]
MSKIDRDIDATEKELAQKKAHKQGVLKRFLVRCPKCKKTSRVSRWVFAQHKEWYMPSDSQGGGWFVDKDWEYCSADCPDCSNEVYIYNHDRLCQLMYHLKKIRVAPKQIFKEVVVGDLDGGTDRVYEAVRRGIIKVEP